MNIPKVVSKLKKKYPGKKVVITDLQNPTEIICEVDPTEEHPTWSRAIAVVDSIRPHYHKKLTETYKVIKGKLIHYLGKESTQLNPGEKIVIPPGEIHWATGNETWFEVYSEPGWIPEDHILVTDRKKISRKEYDQKPPQTKL